MVTSARALGSERSDGTRAARVRAVVDQHYDFVWRCLRRLGVPEGSADDETQQVLCVLARKIDEIERGKEKTFLFGVVLRTAQNARRARVRKAEVHDDDAIAAIPSDGRTPEEELEERRARAVLDGILAEMPMEQRAVFVLYELEELTMIEIAEALGVPQGTVASRLRRAREVFEDRAARIREEGAR